MGEKIMKKIFLILSAIMTTTVVHATQMCARRNTTVIPLDASVEHKGYKSYIVELMWFASFAYGKVYGGTACLSVPEIQKYVPTWDGSASTRPLVIPTDTEELIGRTGDYVASDGTVYPRNYCYCKVTHPMSSHYVAATYSAELANEHCARSDMNNLYKRTTMYNSVGIGYTEIDENEYDKSINLN